MKTQNTPKYEEVSGANVGVQLIENTVVSSTHKFIYKDIIHEFQARVFVRVILT